MTAPTTAPTTAHERTELAPPPGSAPPAAAVAPASSGSHSHSLQAGARLAEFEVTQTIGEGGFGIVYLAWDHSLQRKVALKEYMPSSIATRVDSSEIRARAERHQETFEAGLKSFINEARLLAQFDHPSLLKVYRFWEANGTAYMVMPFLEGQTLRDTIRGLAGPPDEAWILALLAPLFDALTMLHAAQCYHRDIAPDNILLLADGGRPLLLDFGAARRVIGDMTQALTAILKPGYAPVEQYAEVPGMKQGPWTDVYALAAVVHWMILGKTPSPSVGRMFDDAQVSVSDKAAGRYSPAFLGAIDRALAVLPDKRTQTIEAFRRDLNGGTPVPAGAMPSTAFSLPPPTGSPGLAPTTPWQPGAGAATVADDRTRQQTLPPTRAMPRADVAAAPAVPAARRSVVPIAAGAAVAVAVAVAAFVFWPKAEPVPPGTTTASDPRSPPAASAPATTAVVPTTTAPTTSTTTTTTTTTPTTTPPVTTAPVGDGTPAAATTTPATPASPPATTGTTASTGTDAGPASSAAVAPVRRPTPPRAETRPETRPDRRNDPYVDTRPTPPTRPVETRPAETRPAGGDNSAECARLFQRLSLGEADQALMDRIRTLRCR